MKEMEKNGFRSKIRKIISFCFSTCITFSTLTSRKKAKLLSSKTMFPQCPYTPLIQSIYHTLLSSMSMLGVLCHPWWWSAWQIVPNELCLKKKKSEISHCRNLICYLQLHIWTNICCVEFEYITVPLSCLQQASFLVQNLYSLATLLQKSYSLFPT